MERHAPNQKPLVARVQADLDPGPYASARKRDEARPDANREFWPSPSKQKADSDDGSGKDATVDSRRNTPYDDDNCHQERAKANLESRTPKARILTHVSQPRRFSMRATEAPHD